MIGKSISEGFRFALSTKRVLPYLILYFIGFYLAVYVNTNIIDALIARNVMAILTAMGMFVPVLLVLWLVSLWIAGAITDQANYFPRERSMTASFKVSSSRYLSLLCATILLLIISVIVSIPQYIGFLLNILVALAFFFIIPAIIVDRTGCVKAFNRSYAVFRKFPLETFVTWMLVMVICGIVMLIFLTPLAVWGISKLVMIARSMILEANETMDGTVLARTIIPKIATVARSPLFIVFLFIFCVGLALCNVFVVGTRTRLYINAKRMVLRE